MQNKSLALSSSEQPILAQRQCVHIHDTPLLSFPLSKLSLRFDERAATIP